MQNVEQEVGTMNLFLGTFSGERNVFTLLPVVKCFQHVPGSKRIEECNLIKSCNTNILKSSNYKKKVLRNTTGHDMDPQPVSLDPNDRL